MDTLNYEVLAKSGYNGYILKNAPEKVLQFGEGNFLRAFVDYWFDLANEKADWNGKCVLVQPIAPGLAKMINEQEGLYTLYLRGSENGRKVDDKRVISSVSRCLNPYEEEGFKQMMDVAASDDLEIIVSNTTEAGIVYDPACKLEDVPASSFPGKLTQVLYHRYKAGKKGIIMLACELIDNNGKELLKCVNQYIDQWGLDDGFRKYVNEDCTFCGSLVDRIVPVETRQTSKISAQSFSTASSSGSSGNTLAAQPGAGTAATHHWTRSFIVYSCQGFIKVRRARLTRFSLPASRPASASGSSAWMASVQQPSGSSAKSSQLRSS